jgi:hypothetical protein
VPIVTDERRGNPLVSLPLPAFFVVALGLWVVAHVVFALGRVDEDALVGDVVGGLVFATVLTVFIGLRRRRLGGAENAVAYLRATRTGSIPDGVDVSHWPAEVEHTRRGLRRTLWFIRIGGLLPFGLGVWAATEADSRALGIVLAALMVAGWIGAEISVRRTSTRLDRLRAALGA